MTFGRDPAVFQYFPGRGVQVHALATAGQANALAVPCLRVADAREAAGAARAARFASRAARRQRAARAAAARAGVARAPARGMPAADAARAGWTGWSALSSRRGGFRAWEYLFAYGGGTAPWVSAMTQATAAQALARGAVALGGAAYRTCGAGRARRVRGRRRRSAWRPCGRGGSSSMYSFAPACGSSTATCSR